MIGIGIALLLMNIALYVHLVREKDFIGQLSDPIVGSLLLLFGGVYLTTEGIIGPLINWTDKGFVITSEKLWLGVATPLLLLVVFGTILGTWLRHKKYGKPEKRKKKNNGKEGDVSMNYETKATAYAEKHGIVDYEVDGNTMAYKESFPVEGTTYAIIVNLDTMKETRTALESDHPNGESA